MPKHIPTSLKRWTQQVGQHMSPLTHSQIQTIAQFSYAVAQTQEAGQTTAATLMSELLDQSFHAVRQRFREITYEASAKRGAGDRSEVDVRTCFADLLAWCAELGNPDEPLVIALDASNLRDRFTVLAISVVYSGTAIPVAWHIQKADAKGQWRVIWNRLLDHLAGTLPAERTVYALTDRGLQSPELFGRLQQMGWHPVMRIRQQGYFYPDSGDERLDLTDWATENMTVEPIAGVAFDAQLEAVLVGMWGQEADEPLLVLTDGPLNADYEQLYAYRMWIENGFRDLKRGALNWHDTRIRDPKRVERHWLVLALGLVYLIQQAAHITEEVPSPLTRLDNPGGLGIIRYTHIKLLAALLMRLEHYLCRTDVMPPAFAPG